MRIALDATCWANARGYGRFARELTAALVHAAPAHRFVCLGDRASLEALPLAGANVEHHEVVLEASPTRAAAAGGARSPRDMLRMTRAVGRIAPDVFFSPSVYTYFPLPPAQRAVVTIHDAIVERFPHLTMPSRRARLFWAAKVRLALWQARLVLTVSDHAARDIVRMLGVAPDRVRVAVEAPSHHYAPVPPADARRTATGVGVPVDAPWFTYVGGFNPHKRVDLILRALAALVAAYPDAVRPHLLLVGPTAADVFLGEHGRLCALIDELGLGALVHWVGFLPDAVLRALHSGAVALLLPSECEGFGLPAVEAAACACPVIATRESPLPDLLEGGGIFVTPGDLEGLTRAMHALLHDPARADAMGRTALARASRLSWAAAARTTLHALEEAAA